MKDSPAAGWRFVFVGNAVSPLGAVVAGGLVAGVVVAGAVVAGTAVAGIVVATDVVSATVVAVMLVVLESIPVVVVVSVPGTDDDTTVEEPVPGPS